jgi:DNA polymerase III epsilon subunit-like protein
MSGIIFYVLDLETNGLNHRFHEISELSILRAGDRTQLSRKVRVMKPENSNIDALRITNKTMDDLRKGISPTTLVDEVDNFLAEDGLTADHRCIVGHNAIRFDREFLWTLWARHKRTFPATNWLDTMHLAKAAAKKQQLIKPKLNLSAACDIFGVKKVAGQHNAQDDTRNCYFLWECLMQQIDYLDHIKRMPHSKDD